MDNLTEEQKKKLDLLLKMQSLTPEGAILSELEELGDSAEYIAKTFEDLDFRKLEMLVGEKGEKGDKGDTPTTDELVSLIQPLIPEPIKGEKGDKPTKNELLSIIKPLIPKPEKPKEVNVAFIVEDVLSKIKLPENKEFTFESAGDIAKKLESLTGDERLNVSAISGIEDYALKADVQLLSDNVRMALSSPRTSRAPSGGGVMEVFSNGTKVGSGTALNFIGATVSNKDGHTTNISIAPAGVTIGDTITGATQGSVFFAGSSGALSQDNSNLFWDDTNNYFALGHNNPLVRLDVRRTGSGEIAYFLDSNTHGFITGTSSTTGYLSSSSSNTSLAFGINGATDSIFIDTNKRVGIQESAPTAYLHITGQTLYDYLLRVKNTTGDMMLAIRSDINTSEGILSKYGYMCENTGNFQVAGFGATFGGDRVHLYSGFFMKTDSMTGAVVGIDATPGNFNPDASALLDMRSTTKGILFPRMATAQKNAISSPAEGLMVYDNQTLSPYFYSNSIWKQISESYSDTYTPTLRNGANVSSSKAYACQYMRVGNTVTVSGEVEVTVSGANAQTLLGISLPIASNFANSTECSGVGSTQGNTTAADTGSIHADTGNDRAELDFFDTRGASSIISFTFTYRII